VLTPPPLPQSLIIIPVLLLRPFPRRQDLQPCLPLSSPPSRAVLPAAAAAALPHKVVHSLPSPSPPPLLLLLLLMALHYPRPPPPPLLPLLPPLACFYQWLRPSKCWPHGSRVTGSSLRPCVPPWGCLSPRIGWHQVLVLHLLVGRGRGRALWVVMVVVVVVIAWVRVRGMTVVWKKTPPPPPPPPPPRVRG